MSPPPTPTLSQLLALTSGLPVTPIPSPNIASLLSSFHTLTQSRWVSQFLFTPQPIHIPHLLSPTLLQTAFLCNFTSTRVHPPTLHPHPSDPSHALHSHLLFAPVITADHLTVGVGIVDGLSNLGTPWLLTSFPHSVPLRLTFRFARDNQSRRFLFVNDIPDEDITIIYFSHHISPTRCNAFSASFRRSALHSAIAESSGHIDIPRILPALLFVIEDHLQRRCPICTATSSSCTCVLPTLNPSHPYDSAYVRRAFSQTFGHFQGVSARVLNQYPHSSVASQQVNLGSHVSLNPFIDYDIMHKLRIWGVQGTIRNNMGDPRHSSLSDQSFSSDHREHPNCLEPPVISQIETPRRKANSNGTLEELLQIVDDKQKARKGVTKKRMRAPENQEQSLIWKRTDVLDVMPRKHSEQTEEQTQSSGSEVGNNRLVPQSSQLGGDLSVTQVTGNWEQDKQVESSPSKIVRTQPRASVTNIRAAESRNPRAIPIVPIGSLYDDTEDVSEILRRMKRDERKIRNRESAHRSNKRMKARKDALEKEILKEKNRAAVLRSIEIQLRQENLLLRRAVNE